MKAWVGIDPGKLGALALIVEDGRAWAWDWAGADKMRDKLEDIMTLDVKHVSLERVGARPGQGVVSMFSFGANWGWWHGILDGLKAPYALVTPQTWMKGVVGKEGAMVAAARLFPEVSLYGPKGGAKDGRADALLLAHYARRQA
jgi:crossover junction endodeoxyribonuclease RuvC